MKFKPTIIIAFMLCLCTLVRAQQANTAPAHSVDPSINEFLNPIEPANGDDELRQKLTEYHNTAVQMLKWRLEAFRNGMGDIGEVYSAAREVANTKVQLAKDDKERLATLEKILGLTKAMESSMEQQFKGGVGSEGNYLRAKLARENIEIQLLKAKNNDAGAKAQP